MTTIDQVRAWKDVDYRDSLTAAQLHAVPGHPAGPISLADDELAAQGGNTCGCLTLGCCDNPPTVPSIVICTVGTCWLWTIGCCS